MFFVLNICCAQIEYRKLAVTYCGVHQGCCNVGTKDRRYSSHLTVIMPPLHLTQAELHLCTLHLESLRCLGDRWSGLVLEHWRNNTMRLSTQLDCPVILHGEEHSILPTLLYVTAQIPEQGFTFDQISAPNMNATTHGVFRLQARPDLLPQMEWRRVQESLVGLVHHTQRLMGQAVCSESLFSFDEGGEMYLTVHDYYELVESSLSVSTALAPRDQTRSRMYCSHVRLDTIHC